MLTVAEEALARTGRAARQGRVDPPVTARRSTPKPTPSARPTCCSKGEGRERRQHRRRRGHSPPCPHDAVPAAASSTS
ncbi:MAG: hypothetical protein MZV65_24535 [Chromatiales bacterium]|nr:hypothetical protein [Chromatiales bacterium]